MLEEMTIIRAPQDWIPLTLPGAQGTSVKVYKADDKRNRAVLAVKFDKGARLPRHYHHCTAMAYTLSGQWSYDEGNFEQGDVAYEAIGNDHTPWSDNGAELLLVFDSPDGRFIDNIMEDGTVIHMGMPLLKALEGISLVQASQLNIQDLVDIRPPASKN